MNFVIFNKYILRKNIEINPSYNLKTIQEIFLIPR